MDKPWTVSRGPIAAREFDIRKAEAINGLLVRPIRILPTAVGDPIRPFAVGLFDEIRALLKPDVSTVKLRRAVGAFVHAKRYYFASAQPDSMRHGIDGQPIEPLSFPDRLAAQQRYLDLKRTTSQAGAPAPELTLAQARPSRSEQIRAVLFSRDRPQQRSAN